MRYFFSLARPEPALAFSITVPATAGGAVAFGRSALRLGAGLTGTATRAIDMTTITATTDYHLAMTASAVEEPGTGLHRHTGPMRAGV